MYGLRFFTYNNKQKLTNNVNYFNKNI